ncbi:hypothetical protein HPP92_021060 [Vanilla planifolia]|uniref:Uncharacterized protein n=1 Tax=Vanilla planifolia TaxID=51239 RepID=A0A835Q3W4_VANPL|nr:hypothetical protein HPP92_021060 [Vanilla planifolia]
MAYSVREFGSPMLELVPKVPEAVHWVSELDLIPGFGIVLPGPTLVAEAVILVFQATEMALVTQGWGGPEQGKALVTPEREKALGLSAQGMALVLRRWSAGFRSESGDPAELPAHLAFVQSNCLLTTGAHS